MAISQKPKATPNQTAVDVDELINKGGSVASATPAVKAKKNPSAVNLHLLKTPRHTWLLEAVLEKLQKEGF
jgi:hypothetical protein